jgi:tetratricopeptide (TPR) repeat protein
MKKFSYTVIILLIYLLNVSFSYANIPEIVLNQKKAVVTIYVNDKDGKQIGTGTGFIIDSNGIIATNYHVMSMCLEGNNTTLIKMENGAFFPLSELVNFDEENDVAIFKIDGKELPMVKIAKSYEPKQGESIAVIGSPLGLETTVSDGIVSSIRGKDGIIQITAPISPGSSGSPVFNSKGEVIGVATFLIKGGQSLNFAIPVKHVANLLKGTRKVKKKGIVNSEQHPAVTPAPTYKGLTAMDWFHQADALWAEGKFTDPKKAIEYLNNAIRLQSDYAEAYVNRGIAYNGLVQYQHAIEDFNDAILLKPDLVEAYVNRGIAYDELGQQHRAIQDYNKAIRLQPDYVSAYGNRGNAYKKLGQKKRAIEDYNEVIRLQPDDAMAYNNRGNAYDDPDQYQRAIADYNEAIRLKPDYADAYNNRGITYKRSGQYQRAVDDYSEAIRLQPDDAKAYKNRGIAFLSQGNNKLGCRDAQKACALGDCQLLESAKNQGYCL